MTEAVLLPWSTKRGRYLLVACLCAGAHNLIMIAGDRAGGNYAVMTLVSFLIVTPTAYALHSHFTFNAPRSLRALVRFASGTAMALPLSLLAMIVLCSVLTLPVVIAAPISTVLLFLWNYISAHLSIVGGFRRH
jgi:putative flippase GtrA